MANLPDGLLTQYVVDVLFYTHDTSQEDEDGRPDTYLGQRYTGAPDEWGPGQYEVMVQDLVGFWAKVCTAFPGHPWTREEIGRIAHDLFLTRNGHGAGFWDGDWPEPEGSVLTLLAEEMGEAEPYAGDDGMLYWPGHEGPQEETTPCATA